jgi:hypothetical protein
MLRISGSRKSPFSPTRSSSARRRRQVCLSLQTLEDRIVLSTDTFANPAGGDWFVASNWSPMGIPKSGDDVIIPILSANAAVFLYESATLNSLTLDGTLEMESSLTVGNVSGAGTLAFGNGGGVLTGATVSQGITIEGAAELNGATLDDNLNVAGTNVSIENGLVLNGTITLGSDTAAGSLDFQGQIVNPRQSLSGSGSVIFAGTNSGSLGGNSGILIGAQITLDIMPQATLLINTSVTDAGTIQLDSGETLSIAGSLTAGSISGAGTINFGNEVGGGTLTGATLGQGITIEGAGELDGVTLDGNDVISGAVDVQNGLTLNGTIVLSGGSLDFSDVLTVPRSGTDQTLSGDGTVELEGTSANIVTVDSDSMLTIEPTISVIDLAANAQIGEEFTDGLVDEGSIDTGGSGQQLKLELVTISSTGSLSLSGGVSATFFNTTLTNAGTVTIGAGSNIDGDISNSGRVTIGAGSIIDGAIVANSGSITIGAASTIDGFYSSTATATLTVQIGSALTSPVITTGGTFNGTLDATYVNGFSPQPGESFWIIGGENSYGTFTNVYGGTAEYIDEDVYLAIPDIAMTSAVISANGLNVRATYTITGGNLPSAGTIDFYWATGPAIADEIGTTPAAKVTTNTEAGTYTATTSIAILGTQPITASDILAVADSPSADPVNNMVFVAAPPLLAMSSAAISSNGLNVNAVYTITGSKLAAAGTIDFYWATGPTISDEIGTKPGMKVTTKTALGTYTASTSIASLGTEPANATYILTVADSPSADPAQNVSSVALPPAQLAVTREPPTIVVLNSTFDVKISAEYNNGTVDTNFSGPLTIALDPQSTVLGGTLLVNAVNGVADFPDLTLNQVGPGYKLQATSTGLSAVTTNLLNVASWTSLNPLNPSVGPTGTQAVMLLSDGSAMVQGQAAPTSTAWYRLAPDASGNYVAGSWSSLSSMNVGRLFFPSTMLPDGNVFVMGGEYSSSGMDNNTGEIYDPVANTWTMTTPFPNSAFGDVPMEVLPNGQVLCGYINGPQTYIYNPAADPLLNPSLPANSNPWSAAATKLSRVQNGNTYTDQSDEESWVKLPDGSILSYDIFTSMNTSTFYAERYIPSSNQWVDASALNPTNPPSILSDPPTGNNGGEGDELGPAFLEPNGSAFFFGANGNTAVYTSSATGGSWSAGPQEPKQGSSQLVATDDPGAELPNGDILISLSPLGTTPAGGSYTFPTTSYIYEYDPVANTFSNVTPSGLSAENAYKLNMLMLPSGQVMLGTEGGSIQIYTPAGSPQGAWLPVISGVASNGNGSFTLTGTQLNGISEGAAYGDDNEMASNYPIIQLRDSTGGIYYARTNDWSSTGVATGSAAESVQFTLPAAFPSGAYTLYAIANGISSAGQSFTVSQVQTTTSIASSASPSVNGQVVTFTATVTPQVSGTGTPKGTLQFVVDGQNLGSPVSLSGGTATSIGVALGTGSHTVTANYVNSDGAFFNSARSLAGGQQVNALTASNLQNDVTQSLASGNPIILQADPTQSGSLTTILSAVNGLQSPGGPVTLTANLDGGTYTDETVSPPLNLTLVIQNGTLVGASPALTVEPSQGQVEVQDVTLATGTDSPTIQILGGSLTLVQDIVQQTSGGTVAVIALAGGMLNLGTAASPGGNTLNINGSGEFLEEAVFTPVSDIGNDLEVDGTPLAAPYLSLALLCSSASASDYGQSVTFTASIQAANPADGSPGGGVDFVDTSTGTNLGMARLANGVATLTASGITVGTHSIMAVYGGSGSFSSSYNLVPLTVNPANVTSQFSVNKSGLVYNRGTQLFGGTITITNTGTTDLIGILEFEVAGLPAGVTLANATGIAPDGNPYISINLGTGALVPGQSITFTVLFSDPTKVSFVYGFLIFDVNPNYLW